MEDEIYDIITIGGGPSGLLCTITAVTGTPINLPRHFTGLIIDKDEIGEFARHARLRITHSWHLEGSQVIDFLKEEAVRSRIELRPQEKVVDISLQPDGLKRIKTTRGEYLARKVAVCTGFYPYGNLIKHIQLIRPIFGPIEWEIPYIPQEKKYTLAIIGGSHSTGSIAARLKELRPDLEIILIIDDHHPPEPGAAEKGAAGSLETHYSGFAVKAVKKKQLKLELTTTEQQSKQIKCRFVLINYNSYIHHTQATEFLDNLTLTKVNGYLPVDHEGNTAIPGLVAAGNIVTPVSGVLTAFATGFTAGLNLFTQLYKERFNETPVLYPWLPLDNPLQHILLRNQAPG